MPHPNDILPNHPQIYRSSCPAWGLEAVVKFTGNKLHSEHPFQDACQAGCNFQQTSLNEMEKRWGIKTRQHGFKDDLGAFEREAHAYIKKNCFPLLSVPSGVFPDWTGKWRITSHVFVTVEEGDKLAFLTWNFEAKAMARVTWEVMSQYHYDWGHSQSLVAPDEFANALFYDAADTP